MAKAFTGDVVFQPMLKDPRFQNLTGCVFNRLTVLGFAGRKSRKRYWFCRCECGSVTRLAAGDLKEGRTLSCGCYSRERSTTHGKRHTPEYEAYCGAKKRCQNQNDKSYQYYGGRGILFLFESFDEFLIEIGTRPTVKHSVDRIDPNGNYAVGNVRWATIKTQANNRRSNNRIAIGNDCKTLAEWCGGSSSDAYVLAKSRIAKGWCLQCAIITLTGAKRPASCTHGEMVPA